MAVNAPSRQIRDYLKALSPPWLSTGVGEKFVYLIGLGVDVMLEKCFEAAEAHMPGLGDPSTLVPLGSDRLIPRNPNESATSYALRLKQAFDAWGQAGSKQSVIAQTFAYFNSFFATSASVSPRVGAVNENPGTPGQGNTWAVAYSNQNPATGTITNYSPPFSITTTGNFIWDANPFGIPSTIYWRVFPILYIAAADSIDPAPVWGSAGINWGNTLNSWGFNQSSTLFDGWRIVVKTWKSAAAWYQFLLVTFAGGSGAPGSEFSPWSAAGSGNPNGDWHDWGHETVPGIWSDNHTTTSRLVQGPYNLPFQATLQTASGYTYVQPTISNTTGNAVTPITITTVYPHGVASGNSVTINGVVGNPAANGTFVATTVSPTTFSVPATGNGAYSGGGVVTNNTTFAPVSGGKTYTVYYGPEFY